jgi:uncharacterized protein
VNAAIICSALLAGLLFLLGGNVSRLRGKAKDQAPASLTDPLYVAVRAHGNAAEYIPTLMILILLVGARAPSVWATALFVVATAARYVHAFGILSSQDMSRPAPLRLAGAIGTYLAGLALAVAALSTL